MRLNIQHMGYAYRAGGPAACGASPDRLRQRGANRHTRVEHGARHPAPHSCFTHVKDERGRVPDFEFLIPGEGEFDYVRYLKAMRAAGYEEDICVEISIQVQRRTNYDPIAAAERSYAVLAKAFRDAGIGRERRS